MFYKSEGRTRKACLSFASTRQRSLSSSGYRYDGRRKVSQTVAEECDKGTSVAKCEPKLVIPLVEAGSESTAQLQQQLDMEGRGMAVDVEKGLWLV